MKPKPKRDIGYIDLYLGSAFLKTIALWGYGYSTLQCANSLRFKYRIISLIIFKEWEATNFSEAFEIQARDWEGEDSGWRWNLDEWMLEISPNLMKNRGAKHSQARVFVCLDAARSVAAGISSRAYHRRRHETLQVEENTPYF